MPTSSAPQPSHSSDLSDEVLIEQARLGRLEAFEELMARHARWVYTLARRITGHDQDAEDAAQQAFLSAMENLGSFRGEAAFSTWLRSITTRAALAVLRKRKNRLEISLEASTNPDDDSGENSIPHPEYIACWRLSPEELVRRHETARLIQEALESLDEKHRPVFVLRDIEGLSIQETAELLGLSEANVKVRLLRARLKLREILTRTFGDPATRIEPPPPDAPSPIVTSEADRLSKYKGTHEMRRTARPAQ